jgi:hypothetical protein
MEPQISTFHNPDILILQRHAGRFSSGDAGDLACQRVIKALSFSVQDEGNLIKTNQNPNPATV